MFRIAFIIRKTFVESTKWNWFYGVIQAHFERQTIQLNQNNDDNNKRSLTTIEISSMNSVKNCIFICFDDIIEPESGFQSGKEMLG